MWREELRSRRRAVFLGEESQQAVADLELFNHGAEAGMGEIRQYVCVGVEGLQESTHP